MPILNLKGYEKRKPNEKSTVNPHNAEVSSRVWDIGTGVPNNEQILDHIRQFLLATRQWAFVWCHRHPTSNWYFLIGSIVFQAPHTENRLHANLGNSTYYLPYQDPNPFRNH